MNVLAIVLQEVAHEQRGLFDLNLGVSAWTLIIFILLMLALAKWAFPPILGYANAREERIREMMEEARRDREAASSALAEQQRALDSTRDEAQKILADSKQQAESVRAEVLAKARSEQEEMLERAREEIEREREKAVASLHREAVEIALTASAKLLRQKVGTEEDRRFVQDVIARTGDGAGAAR